MSYEDVFRQVVLDTHKVGARTYFSGEMLARARVDIVREEVDRLAVQISTMVRTHNLPPERVTKTTTLQTPATWWQHWKRDVAARRRWLRWIVRRWPIRLAVNTATLTVDLRRFHVYPDAPEIAHASYRLVVRHHELEAAVRWTTEEQP